MDPPVDLRTPDPSDAGMVSGNSSASGDDMPRPLRFSSAPMAVSLNRASRSLPSVAEEGGVTTTSTAGMLLDGSSPDMGSLGAEGLDMSGGGIITRHGSFGPGSAPLGSATPPAVTHEERDNMHIFHVHQQRSNQQLKLVRLLLTEEGIGVCRPHGEVNNLKMAFYPWECIVSYRVQDVQFQFVQQGELRKMFTFYVHQLDANLVGQLVPELITKRMASKANGVKLTDAMLSMHNRLLSTSAPASSSPLRTMRSGSLDSMRSESSTGSAGGEEVTDGGSSPRGFKTKIRTFFRRMSQSTPANPPSPRTQRNRSSTESSVDTTMAVGTPARNNTPPPFFNGPIQPAYAGTPPATPTHSSMPVQGEMGLPIVMMPLEGSGVGTGSCSPQPAPPPGPPPGPPPSHPPPHPEAMPLPPEYPPPDGYSADDEVVRGVGGAYVPRPEDG